MITARHNSCMTAPRKPGRPRSKDRHKPGRQVRIRDVLIRQVDIAAAALAATPPELINRYVREGLQRDGFYKPPGSE